jgi:hypothetical protein
MLLAEGQAIMRRATRTWIVLLFCFAITSSLQAAAVVRQEMRQGELHLVLENDEVRVVVWPEAGGAITEFIDKRNNHDYVAKGVRKGAVGAGWKELTSLDSIEPDSPLGYVGANSFDAQIDQGDGYAAIVVRCTLEHLEVVREMRLEDRGSALRIVVRHTNRADQSRTIWLRFHPFMTFDDSAQASAAILVPGPGPDAIRTVRRVPLEPGYADAHFMDVPGYWMIANPATGAGLWMTFAPDDVMVSAVWTARQNSTAELYPHPRVVAPGESVVLQAMFQPFIAADSDAVLTRQFIPAGAGNDADTFLRRVRPNLPAVGGHTMVSLPGWPTATPSAANPGSPSQQNRFHFMHRRRDRFALRDWGIADAMMEVPGSQDLPLRIQLFARGFEGQSTPMPLVFELRITDALDKVVKQVRWPHVLSGSPQSALDQRQEVSLGEIADGRYTFALRVLEGDGSGAPIHQVVEQHRLAGHAYAAAAAARIRAEQNVPLAQRERPVVTALRQMQLPDARARDLALPLAVEEASGLARQQWPVRVGVPFAQGVLTPTRAITLTAPDGAPAHVQTRVMGTWPDGSAKWLLVDFHADVPARSHVFYTLRTSDTPASASPDLAVVDGRSIRVDTGAAQWRFAPDDPALLGLFDRDGLWWRTADGRDYRMELRGEGAGLSLLENGPLRCVVGVVGWYFPTAGAPDAAPIARGELRAEFYRGQAWHRLDHTFTFTGNAWHDALAGAGARFSHLLPDAQAAQIDCDGKAVRRDAPLSLWQPDEDHALVRSGDGDEAGRRSTGAAALVRDDRRAVVYHRHFWEMFPKRAAIDPSRDRIDFDYWPVEAGTLDWRPREDGWHSSSPAPQQLAVGVSRTHQFVIDRTGALEPQQYQAAFDEPVLAIVPPRYLCQTGALPHLNPYDPGKVPQLEQAISEAIDSYQLHREVFGWYGQWDYGTLHNRYEPELKRWAVYGRYANIMNEQNIAHGPWLAYLRSGDRKHLRFAELQTRHLMEVGAIRWSAVFPEAVGMTRRHHQCPWLGSADYGHSMLDPFVEMYHVTGNAQAWEAAQRMAQAMARQRGGQERYLNNPITGLTRMYLDTQLPFYKEQADRLWLERCAPARNGWFTYDHGGRMAIQYSQINDDCRRLWREMTDANKAFQSLDALAGLWDLTGDRRYADMAAQQFPPRLKNIQTYDSSRSDPLLWSAAMHTQHVLAALREMTYASGALEAARHAADRGNDTPGAAR